MPITTSDSPSLPSAETGSNIVRLHEPATVEPGYLSECSPKDRPWDQHRSQADQIATIFLNAADSRWFSRLGERVELCSQVLVFGWSAEKADSGVLTLKLRKGTYFCRVRHCPVCQWRRSLMWMARFLQAAPGVLSQYPNARFIFLTLTRKNVPITELRGALREMSSAWGRLIKRKEFTGVLGWIRAVEVTRAEDGRAHPHYHVLVMVSADYFCRPEKYVTQAAWTAIWRNSLRLDYDPIVHVTAVKSRAAHCDGVPSRGLMSAARETLKYAVKPADMAAHPAWLLELTRQLHKLRFIASGGVLKDVLREDDETNDDLLVLGDGETDGPPLYFDWWRPVRRYKRRSRFDQ